MREHLVWVGFFCAAIAAISLSCGAGCGRPRVVASAVPPPERFVMVIAGDGGPCTLEIDLTSYRGTVECGRIHP